MNILMTIDGNNEQKIIEKMDQVLYHVSPNRYRPEGFHPGDFIYAEITPKKGGKIKVSDGAKPVGITIYPIEVVASEHGDMLTMNVMGEDGEVMAIYEFEQTIYFFE